MQHWWWSLLLMHYVNKVIKIFKCSNVDVLYWYTFHSYRVPFIPTDFVFVITFCFVDTPLNTNWLLYLYMNNLVMLCWRTSHTTSTLCHVSLHPHEYEFFTTPSPDTSTELCFITVPFILHLANSEEDHSSCNYHRECDVITSILS